MLWRLIVCAQAAAMLAQFHESGLLAASLSAMVKPGGGSSSVTPLQASFDHSTLPSFLLLPSRQAAVVLSQGLF